MYEVKTPILGFDKCGTVEVEHFDIYLSTLVLTDDVSMNIINSKYLTNINIDFSDEFLQQMQIDDNSNYDIYFTTVIQNPIRDSRVNLGAPLVINEDKKIIGQFVSEDNAHFDMPRLGDLNTLQMR